MMVKLFWVMLLFSAASITKEAEIFRCIDGHGNVVIQDRHCKATHSASAKTMKHIKPVKPLGQKARNKPIKFTPKILSGSRPVVRSSKNQARSHYFHSDWSRLTFADWYMSKQQSALNHHLLFSKNSRKGNLDFGSGVKLTVYPKTVNTFNQGAFALALSLYHQIRAEYTNQLIDSQFKTHNRFKIFNVAYQLAESQRALTEFYIDESNNDLFVLTIRASDNNWLIHQKLADQILSKL